MKIPAFLCARVSYEIRTDGYGWVELVIRLGYNSRPFVRHVAGKRNLPIRSCWGARKGQADGWLTLTLNTLELLWL